MITTPQHSEGRKLSQLLAGLADVPDTTDRTINGVSMDSRTCVPGSLFLAASGEINHGLEFLSQAMENGAVAVVSETADEWPSEKIIAIAADHSIPLYFSTNVNRDASEIAARFYNCPSKQLKIIGVTGTNGKTSCAHFIAQALSSFHKCGVIGTIGVGFPDNLHPASHTTPGPVILQSHLQNMLCEGAVTVAMEVSSHGMEQRRVDAVEFDVVVLTNLTRDHLDYHGSMDAYADAKRQLFIQPDLQWTVLNLDDSFGRELLEQVSTTAKTIGYSIESGGSRDMDYWIEAIDVESSQQGLKVTVESSWGEGIVESALLGRFNVSNLLAVLGVLLSQGIDFDAALKCLGDLQTVPGRMERFGGDQAPLIVVDYAHTPDALEQALLSLRQHTTGRLICVFGCGGDRDSGKRPQMAAIAECCADRIIVTDDNPRTEDGDEIIRDIFAGIQNSQRVEVLRNRSEAISHAITIARETDTVLVAGKGHEDYQLIGGQRLDFSDRDCVSDCLARERR